MVLDNCGGVEVFFSVFRDDQEITENCGIPQESLPPDIGAIHAESHESVGL